ncbi:MAG: hypothetical protein JNK05_08995 [Myxococcales bacterium]|nr:hypothetical protein [Myxococcales bacterium]
MAWSEAIERLREAGDSEPGLTAGWCGLEPEAIEWAVKERVFGDVYDPTRHASALTRSASSEAAVEEAMSDDALPYSDSAFRLWFDSANRLRLNDVVVHAFSRAFVAFDTKDSLWWLADTLMNQGMFEDAIAIANRLEIEFSSSLRSDARLRSLLTALRATARLTLGRYREVIDDPNARIDLRLAAIARSFDSSALTKVVEIGLGPIFGDGPTELAITFPGAMPLEVPESPFDWLRLEAIGSHMIHEKPSYLLGELPLRALFGAYEYRLALTHLAASRALLRYSFTEQALEHAVLARTRFLSLFGPSHHFVGRAYLAEGRALFARGEWSSARDTFALAIASLDASVGPDHPDAHEARFEHAWTRRFLREEDTTASLRAHYAAIITRVPETHPRLRSLAERIDLPSDLAFLPKSTLEADP